MNIRLFKNEDWTLVWKLICPVIRKGETYPYDCDMTSEEAHYMWVNLTQEVYVAEDNRGSIIATYYIKPNQPSLGAHVANCGYIVAEDSRYRGIGRLICEHSQNEAIKKGYRAIQFNLVVETNEVSIYLWKKLGFSIVGRLPAAFKHKKLGYVAAYVMFKELIKE